MCNFPALNELSLNTVRWPYLVGPSQKLPNLSHSILPTLHSLTVKCSPTADVLHWLLLDNKIYSQMHTLYLVDIAMTMEVTKAIDKLLPGIGPSLKHFHCGYVT